MPCVARRKRRPESTAAGPGPDPPLIPARSSPPAQPCNSRKVTDGGAGVLAALGAGMFATRKVLDAPPSVTLRELQG